MCEYTKSFNCSCDWMDGAFYWDSQKWFFGLQIGTDFCAVFTTDVDATGEDNIALSTQPIPALRVGDQPWLVFDGKQPWLHCSK